MDKYLILMIINKKTLWGCQERHIATRYGQASGHHLAGIGEYRFFLFVSLGDMALENSSIILHNLFIKKVVRYAK
jgi:hypothetical protein